MVERTCLSSSITWRCNAFLAVALLFLAACGGGGGGNGGSDEAALPPSPAGADTSTAVRTTQLQTNDPDCPAGGILVETGIDENGNGILDDDEVDEVKKVCHGEDGLDSLLALSDEPAGANCPYGGLRVDSGQDANGNGVLDTGEITQTQFLCAQIDGAIGWQVATLIETQPDMVNTPSLAVDGQGRAMAVWHQGGDIRASRFIPGRGWETPQAVDDTPNIAAYPVVAMDTAGNAWAVWYRKDGDRWGLWASHYVPGSGWSTPAGIDAKTTSDTFNPDIAMDDAGNVLVVWQEDGDIWANRFVAGSGWQGAQRLDNLVEWTYLPKLAMNTNGNAMAVWEQNNAIWASRFAGESWRTPEILSMPTIDPGIKISQAQVAMDDAGNAIAVWQRGGYIMASRYTAADENWTTPVPINADDGGAGRFPVVTMNGQGNAVVVWHQEDAADMTRLSIWANSFTVGEGWQGPRLLETGNAGSAVFPAVAMDSRGNAVAVWSQHDGLRWNLWSNRFLSGLGWGNAELVETDDGGNAGAPAFSAGLALEMEQSRHTVAMDPNGNAVTLWPQENGGNINLWANIWLAP